MRRIASFAPLLLLAATGALVAGCNTVQGMGRDVQAAGREIGGLFGGGAEAEGEAADR